jgi:hypothetical protein
LAVHSTFEVHDEQPAVDVARMTARGSKWTQRMHAG